jgi:hypothetical protein
MVRGDSWRGEAYHRDGRASGLEKKESDSPDDSDLL